jgi:ABC-type antimicrobial peptide transport system permease subunit
MTRLRQYFRSAVRWNLKNLIVASVVLLAFLFGLVVKSYAAETLRMFQPGSLMGRVDAEGFQWTLLGVLTLVDLGLVVAGIYGLMSFSVTQRTPEIGRQLAGGAKMSEVLKLVLGHGMRLAVFGAVIGLGTAFLLARWIKMLLFGVEATDPLAFVGVAVVLSGVAFLAMSRPAPQAAKLVPMALRHKRR